MSQPFTLRRKDYTAIGGYVEQHGLRLALVDWPNKMVYFRGTEGEVKVLLSHVHEEYNRIKAEMRKAK